MGGWVRRGSNSILKNKKHAFLSHSKPFFSFIGGVVSKGPSYRRPFESFIWLNQFSAILKRRFSTGRSTITYSRLLPQKLTAFLYMVLKLPFPFVFIRMPFVRAIVLLPFILKVIFLFTWAFSGQTRYRGKQHHCPSTATTHHSHPALTPFF